MRELRGRGLQTLLDAAGGYAAGRLALARRPAHGGGGLRGLEERDEVRRLAGPAPVRGLDIGVCRAKPGRRSFYTHRPRRADEIFPWEHISDAVRKKYLYTDYLRSLAGETHTYCREGCDACGILPTFAATRREHPGLYWKCPEVKSPKKRVTSNELRETDD